MRISRIRSRLREGHVVRFSCQYYPTALMPTYAAHAGLDALWLDTEHNAWDRRELQRMLLLYHLAGIDCIVRTGHRNPTELYRLLEDGAAALMIPMVNTPEDASALVRAVKFPPVGQRGLDGSGIDNEFYFRGAADYPAQANEQTVLIIQIETLEALGNLDKIAAVPGIDGFFIGPGDISLRLKCPMDWKCPPMMEAQSRVAAAALKNGIAWGRPGGSVEDIRSIVAAGGQLINHGSDFFAVASMMKKVGEVFAAALEGKEQGGKSELKPA